MTSTLEYISAAVTDRGLSESRPQNEDSFLEMPQIGLFAVADGVGGAQAGEVASQMAVEILAEAFVNMNPTADPEDIMRIALTRANEAIYSMAHDLSQLASMATTIAAVHVAGDMITIGHVGDSRVYRFDGNGKLMRETDDHSLVEEEVRAGRMTPEQALTHPSRNVISRALGADFRVEPDIKCILIKPGTRLMLCSDGITRHIPDAELESLVGSSASPSDICGQMKDLCFGRGAEDNLTAVIVEFPGDLAQETFEVEYSEQSTVAGVRELQNEPLAKVTDGRAEPANLNIQDDDVLQVEHLPAPPESDSLYKNALSEPDADLSQHSEQTTEPSVVPTLNNVDQRSVANAQLTEVSGPPVFSTYEPVPEKGRGWASRIVAALGLLILGAGAGIATSYYLLRSTLQPVVQAPAITEQKSNNVVLTSFEERRRLVDADPAGYLIANAATPQTADDHLWLGRALMLTAKPVEAKRQFEEARRLLPALGEPENMKTVANEIAMGLVISENAPASEALTKQLNPETDSAEANTNTGPPVRSFRRRRWAR